MTQELHDPNEVPISLYFHTMVTIYRINFTLVYELLNYNFISVAFVKCKCILLFA